MNAVATAGQKSGRSTGSRFLELAGQYWRGNERPTAWTLTVAVGLCIAAGVYIQARINVWNGEFFTALERKSQSDFVPLLWQFAGYTIAAGAVMALTILSRMALQVRLRQCITQQLIQSWLGQQRFYRLFQRTGGAETPEFRIADDVRLATDPMVDLTIGFVTSLMLGVTFLTVLADVGGALSIPSLGVSIPGYCLIGALLYASLMSGLASTLGWPLIKRIAAKNHREGVLRYQLTRVRENAPAIAAGGRESAEHGTILGALSELVRSWSSVITAQSKVAGIASANAVLVGVVPVVLAVPKYVSGDMTLGAVMQLATAFIQVQLALNWMVDNFVRFAEWQASANRVGEFVATLEALDRDEAAPVAAATSEPMVVSSVPLVAPVLEGS